jgi:hypothetical protein
MSRRTLGALMPSSNAASLTLNRSCLPLLTSTNVTNTKARQEAGPSQNKAWPQLVTKCSLYCLLHRDEIDADMAKLVVLSVVKVEPAVRQLAGTLLHTGFGTFRGPSTSFSPCGRGPSGPCHCQHGGAIAVSAGMADRRRRRTSLLASSRTAAGS